VEINEEKIDRWAHNDSLKVRDVGWFITPQLCGITSLCTVYVPIYSYSNCPVCGLSVLIS
jgi:hypothetical protein